MTTMHQLNKLAESLNCHVEDDKDNPGHNMLWIHANDGFAWDGGELHSICEQYQANGQSWKPKAIQDAYTRLVEMGEPEPESVEV